jgi:hypothetical protein
MKFFYFFWVDCPLYCHLWPGTFTASMWSIEVLDPGYSSFSMIEPQFLLCDLFMLFFSRNVWHVVIWHSAICHVDLISPFLILYCISCLSACVYVSCKCNTSCCAVFKFDVYAVIYFDSSMATCLRPILLGCCKNDDFAGVMVCLSLNSGMQLIVSIFFWG